MIARKRWGLVLSLILAAGARARGADERAVIDRAAGLLEEISSDPESGIPRQALEEAKGIIIWPHFVETRLGLGRSKGRGVFLLRKENGEWGQPEIIEVSGFSVGPELGRRVTDMVAIYRAEKAMDHATQQTWKFEMCFEASGSIGHPHRFHAPKTSVEGKKTLVYSRSSGMLAGMHLGGERRSGTPSSNLKEKTPIAAPAKAGEAEAGKGDPAVARTAADPPETARLKSALAAMMKAPPKKAKGAKKGESKDDREDGEDEEKPANGEAASPR